jgi:hypothetical protein
VYGVLNHVAGSGCRGRLKDEFDELLVQASVAEHAAATGLCCLEHRFCLRFGKSQRARLLFFVVVLQVNALASLHCSAGQISVWERQTCCADA